MAWLPGKEAPLHIFNHSLTLFLPGYSISWIPKLVSWRISTCCTAPSNSVSGWLSTCKIYLPNYFPYWWMTHMVSAIVPGFPFLSWSPGGLLQTTPHHHYLIRTPYFIPFCDTLRVGLPYNHLYYIRYQKHFCLFSAPPETLKVSFCYLNPLCRASETIFGCMYFFRSILIRFFPQ